MITNKSTEWLSSLSMTAGSLCNYKILSNAVVLPGATTINIEERISVRGAKKYVTLVFIVESAKFPFWETDHLPARHLFTGKAHT